MKKIYIKLLFCTTLLAAPLYAMENKDTLLLQAAENGDTEQVVQLLNQETHIDGCTDIALTSLMRACECNNQPAIAFLLEAGADVDAVDYAEETCLSCLVRGELDDKLSDTQIQQLVLLLLDYGANPNQRCISSLCFWIPRTHLLHVSVDTTSKNSLLEPLLTHNASQYIRSGIGYLPIHVAAGGPLSVLKKLLFTPQGVAWYTNKKTRDAQKRVFTLLCCRHRNPAILKDIIYKICEYFPDTHLDCCPLGAYWKHAKPQILSSCVPLKIQKQMGQAIGIEKLILINTHRHMQMLTKLLLAKVHEDNDVERYYYIHVETGSAYDIAQKTGNQQAAALLDPETVINLRPIIEENYRKFFTDTE